MNVEVTTPEGESSQFDDLKLRFFDEVGTSVSVTLGLASERTLMHTLIARAQERGEHLTV